VGVGRAKLGTLPGCTELVASLLTLVESWGAAGAAVAAGLVRGRGVGCAGAVVVLVIVDIS